MKKVFSLLLCLLMLLSLTIPTLAADDVLTFTTDSKFELGGTAKVDGMKTRQAIMDLGKDAAEYNAALEGNVEFVWYRDGLSWGYGESYTFKDYGEYFCRVFLYEDAEQTQQCGYYTSQTFTIAPKIPEITTQSLPNGKVGEEYYCKLECTDADVVFGLYQSSLPDGMYITQHGEIEGTPTKAGFYHINVIATPEAGEEYAAMASFEFTIEEAGPTYTLEIMQTPNKLTYTAGEKLDMTGLRVRIWTPDGYIDSKDGEHLTYSKKALVTLGEQKIKLAYEDAFEIFIVTVVAAPETEPTTSSGNTQQTTETATVPEQTTEATTTVTEEATVDVVTDPTEEELPQILDGPGSEGPTDSDAWIVWVVLVTCILLLLAAAAVVVIVIVVKKKKAG